MGLQDKIFPEVFFSVQSHCLQDKHWLYYQVYFIRYEEC